MKKGISALLALVLCLGCFTGCARSIDNSAYVPTGNAILMEGEEPEEETIARLKRLVSSETMCR